MCRFHCELDVWVLIVDMLKKFLAVFCLVDDKGVIYKPEPKGGVGKEERAFTSNSSIKMLAMRGADGGTHSCTLDLFIILTLEEEVGVGQAELQQGGDLLDGHAGSLR